MGDSYIPENMINTLPTSWSPDGELSVSINDQCGTISTEVFDKDSFCYLAKCYNMQNLPDIGKTCDFNAMVFYFLILRLLAR